MKEFAPKLITETVAAFGLIYAASSCGGGDAPVPKTEVMPEPVTVAERITNPEDLNVVIRSAVAPYGDTLQAEGIKMLIEEGADAFSEDGPGSINYALSAYGSAQRWIISLACLHPSDENLIEAINANSEFMEDFASKYLNYGLDTGQYAIIPKDCPTNVVSAIK